MTRQACRFGSIRRISRRPRVPSRRGSRSRERSFHAVILKKRERSEWPLAVILRERERSEWPSAVILRERERSEWPSAVILRERERSDARPKDRSPGEAVETALARQRSFGR